MEFKTRSLYLWDADVDADVFRQVDHVSLLGHHHDEAGQRLRVERIHWIFFFLFILFLVQLQLLHLLF